MQSSFCLILPHRLPSTIVIMSKSEAEPKASSPAVLNKDLIKQFDKVLSVSCQKPDQKKSCLTGGVRQGSVQRKRRSRKKKVFVLRPSRLKVDPVEDNPTPSNHFSFEKCSRELESILAPSSSSCRLVFLTLVPTSTPLKFLKN